MKWQAEDSYGEFPSRTNYDLIIVGAGITGLNAAVYAKKQQPNLNVLLVERGWISAGATINSAGFACLGSLSELLHFEARSEETTDSMLALTKRRLEGLKRTPTGGASRLISTLSRKGILRYSQRSKNSFFRSATVISIE